MSVIGIRAHKLQQIGKVSLTQKGSLVSPWLLARASMPILFLVRLIINGSRPS